MWQHEIQFGAALAKRAAKRLARDPSDSQAATAAADELTKAADSVDDALDGDDDVPRTDVQPLAQLTHQWRRQAHFLRQGHPPGRSGPPASPSSPPSPSSSSTSTGQRRTRGHDAFGLSSPPKRRKPRRQHSISLHDAKARKLWAEHRLRKDEAALRAIEARLSRSAKERPPAAKRSQHASPSSEAAAAAAAESAKKMARDLSEMKKEMTRDVAAQQKLDAQDAALQNTLHALDKLQHTSQTARRSKATPERTGS